MRAAARCRGGSVPPHVSVAERGPGAAVFGALGSAVGLWGRGALPDAFWPSGFPWEGRGLVLTASLLRLRGNRAPKVQHT